MSLARELRAPTLALCGALAVACAGSGFDRSELPTEPLVLVHRTTQESERVAELLERAAERRRGGREEDAPIRLEQVSDALGLGPTREERRADYHGRLALLEPRSGELERLGFATRGARPMDWSPDHERLLLMSLRSGTPQIYEYRFDRRELRPVTHGPASHVAACYGPGGRIAVSRQVTLESGDTGIRIFVKEPGGGAARPVTPGPRDVAPDWSARRGVLVYQTRDARGAAAIASVRLEGAEAGEPRVHARGRDPVLTPGGEWVVYSAETRRGWRLWRMRPDGSARRALADTGQEQRFPAVSPDGRFVAYTTFEERENVGEMRFRLWVRRLDGRGRGRPILDEGDALRPQW